MGDLFAAFMEILMALFVVSGFIGLIVFIHFVLWTICRLVAS